LKTASTFSVRDHTVTGEEFTLKYVKELDMFQTIPQPAEKDLAKYYASDAYISHTASKRNVLEKVYHLVRAFMLKRKYKLVVNNTKAHGALLDIGCGTGDFLMEVKKQGWDTLGVEPNLKARSLAREKGLQVYDALRLEQMPPNSFDVITLWHVLEHLPNLDAQINIIKNLLKPDGLLVIAVPNFNSFDARYYKAQWAAYDVPRHLWHFSKTAIRRLFQPHGLQVYQIKPMWFDAFYVSMLSEFIRAKKFAFIKGLIIGATSNLSALGSKEFSSQIYLLKRNK